MERRCNGEDGPTLLPHPEFDPLKDAAALNTATTNKHGDKNKIFVDILCHRTSAQRMDITKTYFQRYHENLLDVIRSETSGDLQNLLGQLVQTPAHNDAKHLHDALKGHSVDKQCILEIMCTRSDMELEAIREQYHSAFRTSLDDDIRKKTSKYFAETVLDYAANNGKDPTLSSTPHEDGRRLLEAQRQAALPKLLTELIRTRSRSELRSLGNEFQAQAGISLLQTLQSDLAGGEYKDVVTKLVEIIGDIPAYFAHRLHHATKGCGTSDAGLIRIVVSRAEKDLQCIKERYYDLYNMFLEESVEGDTSHDYKRALLALILGN